MDISTKIESDLSPVKILLQLIPGLGGAAGELWGQLNNKIRAERFEYLIQQLAIGDLELTQELLESEKFLTYFVALYEIVIKTQQKNKIDAMAALFKNYYNYDLQEYDEYEEYLSILDELSIFELDFLRIIYNEIGHIKHIDGDTYKILDKGWHTIKEITIAEFDISETEFKGRVFRLYRTGLYHPVTGFGADGVIGITTPLLEKLITRTS